LNGIKQNVLRCLALSPIHTSTIQLKTSKLPTLSRRSRHPNMNMLVTVSDQTELCVYYHQVKDLIFRALSNPSIASKCFLEKYTTIQHIPLSPGMALHGGLHILCRRVEVLPWSTARYCILVVLLNSTPGSYSTRSIDQKSNHLVFVSEVYGMLGWVKFAAWFVLKKTITLCVNSSLFYRPTSYLIISLPQKGNNLRMVPLNNFLSLNLNGTSHS